MKSFNGIQSPFDDAIVPVPGNKGDMGSSDPGVPVRDAPATTNASEIGPMTLTVQGGGLSHDSAKSEGSKIKPGM